MPFSIKMGLDMKQKCISEMPHSKFVCLNVKGTIFWDVLRVCVLEYFGRMRIGVFNNKV